MTQSQPGEMTPNHIPANDGYPGMVRFKTKDGRTFCCLGNPDLIADTVAKMIEGRE